MELRFLPLACLSPPPSHHLRRPTCPRVDLATGPIHRRRLLPRARDARQRQHGGRGVVHCCAQLRPHQLRLAGMQHRHRIRRGAAAICAGERGEASEEQRATRQTQACFVQWRIAVPADYFYFRVGASRMQSLKALKDLSSARGFSNSSRPLKALEASQKPLNKAPPYRASKKPLQQSAALQILSKGPPPDRALLNKDLKNAFQQSHTFQRRPAGSRAGSTCHEHAG
eukprot:42249-Chlamydomonas_euryale.AAC.3